jgi:hypothetical protein
MEKINRKVMVIGVLFLLLGASTILSASASTNTRQIPGSIQRTIPAINQEIVAKTSLVGNVQISTNQGNDQHPKLTTNSQGDIIVVFEEDVDIFTKDLPVVYSADDGITWTQQFLFNSLDFQGSGLLGYCDIVYNAPNDLIWIAAVDPNADMYNNEMFFIPGDIASATEANGYAISGTSSSGYLYCGVACTTNYFVSATTEDYPGYEQIMGFGWFTSPDFAYPPAIGGYYYDGQSIFESAPVAEIEMDQNSNRLFIVFESEKDDGTYVGIKSNTADETLIDNGEQQNGMDKYGDIEQMPGEWIGLGTDPDVSGSGSKVAVVYIQDGNVMCSVSSCSALYEPEFSWSTTTVDTGGASAPAVYLQGNTIGVAYVKGGNLWYKVSEDSGATWSAAIQKNDQDGTVVNEKSAVDLCKAGIAFTDNRNGNNDIFFAEAKGAAAPQIVIGAISGGIGVSAVISNVGDAAATNVAWSIVTEGTVFIGKEKTGTIATLNPGASETVKTGLMLGFGAITVKVTADTATKTQGFKLLLIFVS